MAARWDGDDRGRGVADARQLGPGAAELLAALRAPDWVTEDPDFHLRPHIERWCEDDGRLALLSADIDETGAYVLELEWRGEPDPGVGQVRATVFALVGSFAESATYVRQRRLDSTSSDPIPLLHFEIGTGELPGDARFAPHGHVVLVNVAGPAPS